MDSFMLRVLKHARRNRIFSFTFDTSKLNSSARGRKVCSRTSRRLKTARKITRLAFFRI